MRKKKILLIPLVLLILAILLGAVAESMDETADTAKTPKAEESEYRITFADEAGLIRTDTERTEIQEAMKGVAEYCSVGFYTTTETGSDWEKKAKNWGFNEFGDTDYTIFCIDMNTRRIGIYSSEAIYKIITTGKANTITDNVYKDAKKGDYASCAKNAFEQMEAVLEGRKIAEPMRYVSNAMVAVAGAILLAYLIINAKMQQEEEVGLADIVKVTAAGAGTAVLANVLTRKVVHQSSSGSHHSGGGFSGGGGHHGGGGGSHGF